MILSRNMHLTPLVHMDSVSLTANTLSLALSCTHLDGLCLARSSRPCWSSPKPQMQCSSESEVASVSEGSDDKATSVAKVLVAVHKLSIDRSNEQLVLPIVPVVEGQWNVHDRG